MSGATGRASVCAGGAMCVLLLSAPAQGDHVWMSPTGGAFAAGANWSTGAMPGPTDTAVFALPAAFDVWASAPMAAHAARISVGDVRFVFTGGGSLELLHAGSSMFDHSLDIGGPAPGAALRVAGGSLLARSSYLASDTAHVALAEVGGAGSGWMSSGNLHVGFAGRATLRVVDGGACGARSVIIGGSFSSFGEAYVSGHGAALSASTRVVVGSSGQGSLVIDRGAACLTAYAEIGAYAGGKGDVRVSGAGSSLDALQGITVGGSVFSSKAGVGSLVVEDGANVSTGRLILAEMAEGAASVVVRGADTFLSAQDVVIGADGSSVSVPSAAMRVGAGGTLLANAVTVSAHGRLDGSGLVNSSVVSRGIVEPGDDAPGALRVDGNYEQVPGPNYALATSELRIRIGAGTDAPGAARLDVGGVASLGGRLRVSFVPGFEPSVGQVFRVLSASSVQGAFQQIILPLPTTAWRLRYLSDASGASIEIIPGGIPGDTNGDCVVNFADLNNVLSGYGQTGVGLIGDANGDGVVNFSDLNLVLSSFGQSCVL